MLSRCRGRGQMLFCGRIGVHRWGLSFVLCLYCNTDLMMRISCWCFCEGFGLEVEVVEIGRG